MTHDQKMNIWQLVYLAQELDDIADELDLLAAQHDLAIADHGLYEALLRQVNRCHSHLHSALARQRG